jgi:Ca-activated chloride channel family protein
VTFTDHPSVVIQPTYDRKAVAAAVPLKTKEVGTQIGGAVKRSVEVAVKAVGQDRPGSPHPPAAILLLSDGKETQPGTKLEAATNLARRSNVPISTIALGTASGRVRVGKVLTGGFDQTKMFPVPVDGTTLQSIATATHGKYSQAPTLAALQQVFVDLGSHQAKEHKRHEVSAAAVGLALLFIFPAVLLSGIWFRRVA